MTEILDIAQRFHDGKYDNRTWSRKVFVVEGAETQRKSPNPLFDHVTSMHGAVYDVSSVLRPGRKWKDIEFHLLLIMQENDAKLGTIVAFDAGFTPQIIGYINAPLEVPQI